ncbi:hypothetical protein COU57_05825 [Candidatus Pacearchaeota archaeon CG10_big_fil_rev_8_21_14_0_10_32_14]|nr:MAG: hypothetical protein COU57_05825 [Candidatus Pacearchaeota archaeon CG10_big_fil_rev_8_21_14_0_10_32_14]
MERVVELPMVEKGKDYNQIIVPTKSGETFPANQSFKGNYQGVGKQILRRGLAIPTGEQVANLLSASYCVPKIKYEK